MNKSGRANLTTIFIALTFGFVAFFLAYNTYSGIIVNNDATIGSDILEFQSNLSTAQSNLDSTGQTLKDGSNDPDENIFNKVADFLDSAGDYIAVGWGAIQVFSRMPDNIQSAQSGLQGSMYWIDDTIWSALTISILIFILFLILKSKKTTSEIA